MSFSFLLDNIILVLSLLGILILLIAFCIHYFKRCWRAFQRCEGCSIGERFTDCCINLVMRFCVGSRTTNNNLGGPDSTTRSEPTEPTEPIRAGQRRVLVNLRTNGSRSFEEIALGEPLSVGSPDGYFTASNTVEQNVNIGSNHSETSLEPPMYEDLDTTTPLTTTEPPSYTDFITNPEKYRTESNQSTERTGER